MISDSNVDIIEVINYYTDKIELDLYRFDSHLHDCYASKGKEEVVQKIKDMIKSIKSIRESKIEE